MAHVSVTINGRTYKIACDDGQEAHLEKLANYVDARTRELVATVGQIGDSHLLVMTSLMIADELSDAISGGGGDNGADASVSAALEAETALSANMEALAKRIETVAQRLEGA